MPQVETPARADLLITDAELIATVDDARREIPGGWVAVTGGMISGLGGPGGDPPAAVRTPPAPGRPGAPGAGQTHHPPHPKPTPGLPPPPPRGPFRGRATTGRPLSAPSTPAAAW